MSDFLPAACLLRPAQPDDAVGQEAQATWDLDSTVDGSCHDRATTGLDDAQLAGLIARIERRDARALEALYEMAGTRIYNFAHRFMRSHALTEEVVEDTFWQAWRQAPRFDHQRGRVMTWLLAMARSRAIDTLRREQRFIGEPLATTDEDAQVDERAHDLLEAARGASRLHGALAALEPRGRQLLALAFFRGLTHEEIAAHTTMPLGSVKSVIRRALLQLREQLQAAPQAPPVSTQGTP
ncbi:MAG TPA: sigma-70 family RNA polymerase sigma factor [Burkholderiaceae bacterium]